MSFGRSVAAGGTLLTAGVVLLGLGGLLDEPLVSVAGALAIGAAVLVWSLRDWRTRWRGWAAGAAVIAVVALVAFVAEVLSG